MRVAGFVPRRSSIAAAVSRHARAAARRRGSCANRVGAPRLEARILGAMATADTAVNFSSEGPMTPRQLEYALTVLQKILPCRSQAFWIAVKPCLSRASAVAY